jgi:hypothetical protein
MKNWWLRRTVKLRLALWYAAATATVLIAFAVFFRGDRAPVAD